MRERLLLFLSLMPTDHYGEQCNTPEPDTPGFFSCNHRRTRAAIISRAIHFSSGLAWRCYAIYRNAEMDVLSYHKEEMAKGMDRRTTDVCFINCYPAPDRGADQYAFFKNYFCHPTFK